MLFAYSRLYASSGNKTKNWNHQTYHLSVRTPHPSARLADRSQTPCGEGFHPEQNQSDFLCCLMNVFMYVRIWSSTRAPDPSMGVRCRFYFQVKQPAFVILAPAVAKRFTIHRSPNWALAVADPNLREDTQWRATQRKAR